MFSGPAVVGTSGSGYASGVVVVASTGPGSFDVQ